MQYVVALHQLHYFVVVRLPTRNPCGATGRVPSQSRLTVTFAQLLKVAICAIHFPSPAPRVPDLPLSPEFFPKMSSNSSTPAAADVPDCGAGGGADTYTSLRIASIFIILACSMAGALFPVLAHRSSWLNVPKPVFEYVIFFFEYLNRVLIRSDGSFAKYFGSGVIVRLSISQQLQSLTSIDRSQPRSFTC